MLLAHFTPTEMPVVRGLLLAVIALGVVLGFRLRTGREERRRKRWPNG